jgi:hypothetical protein
MIASKKKTWAEALELYEHAKNIFEELGDRHNIGRVSAELGMMYLQRNQDQDRERAKMYVSEAHEIFSALGARSDLEKLPNI